MCSYPINLKIILLTIGLCFTPFVSAETKNTVPPNKIEKLIQQYIPNTAVGIIVRDAKTGKTIYSKNANQPFIPASGTKLFTASAALLALGPNYQFETVLKQKEEDLYLAFCGDPSLSTQDLKTLLETAKTIDLSKIKHIFIDDTRFKGLEYALGWDWNSTWWYYGAPISTIILNANAIPIQLLPTQAPGEKIIAQLKSQNPAIPFTLTHDIISVTNEQANQCVFMVDTNNKNDVHLSGCWPTQQKEMTLKIALKNPTLLAKQIILASLSLEQSQLPEIKTGINIENIKDLKTITSHRSKSLAELLPQILQESDNVYTESFTKTLGAVLLQEGTFQAGVKSIQTTLNTELGLDFTQTKMMDGSGLSRYNLITPTLFSELLFKLYHHPMGGIFKNALAISGVHGTLKNRLSNQDPQKQDPTKEQVKIYAKTGTLTGVSTLSGYLDTHSKQTLIFSIMINNSLNDSKEIKAFEDALCQLFFEHF